MSRANIDILTNYDILVYIYPEKCIQIRHPARPPLFRAYPAVGKKNTAKTVFFSYSVLFVRVQAVRQKPSIVLYSGTSTYAGSKSDLCIVNVTESPRHVTVTSNVSGSVQYAGQ